MSRTTTAAGSYRRLSFPWTAVFSADARAPARLLAELLQQTLRYGMPGTRRGGRLLALLARRPPPRSLIERTFAVLPRSPHMDVDRLLAEAADAWGRLLPGQDRPERLTALALERSSALTVFVFAAEAGEPSLVMKAPRGGGAAEREAAALEAAAPAAVAPRFLGRTSSAFVQSFCGGEPLRVEPITRDDAAGLRWDNRHQQVADALTRLAEVTANPASPPALEEPVAAAARAGLPESVGRVLEEARAAAARWPSVLQHGDMAPQNCLFDGHRFSGLVDWELSDERGTPGFDVLTAAISYLEHGLALGRWSQELVVDTFAAAWRGSQHMAAARAAAAHAASRAGVRGPDLPSVEVLFFARRLGRRLVRPDRYATTASTAARMLEVACAR